VIHAGSPHPALPGGLEFREALETGKQVDAHRSDAELHDPGRIGEIFRGVTQIGAAEENTDGLQGTGRIFRGGIQEDVKILGRARPGVEGHRVGSHDEVPDPMAIQCVEKLFVILGDHPHLVPEGRIPGPGRRPGPFPRESCPRTRT